MQLFASGRISIRLMVYGRSHGCNRSSKIRTPQRRASGTEKSLCRQGATQRVAPGLLTCPIGFAACPCAAVARAQFETLGMPCRKWPAGREEVHALLKVWQARLQTKIHIHGSAWMSFRKPLPVCSKAGSEGCNRVGSSAGQSSRNWARFSPGVPLVRCEVCTPSRAFLASRMRLCAARFRPRELLRLSSFPSLLAANLWTRLAC